MKEIFLIVTIVGLLLVGFMIALGSGEENPSRTSSVRNLATNVAMLMFRLAAYGLALSVVQRVVGAPSLPIW